MTGRTTACASTRTELRARVVGEGGNLGLTQRGRIEFWTRGALVNTDAVDNSAGVDMSDHEVNIKILLDLLVRSGVIKDRAARNAIIARDDRQRVRAGAGRQHQPGAGAHARRDAQRGRLRGVGRLRREPRAGRHRRAAPTRPCRASPSSSPAKARDRGLPRPVLCVLLGHVKNWVYVGGAEERRARQRRRAAVPRRVLPGEAAATSSAAHFGSTRCKREIIATCVINYLVNHAGISVPHPGDERDEGRRRRASSRPTSRWTGLRRRRACAQALYAQKRPVKEELEVLLAIERRHRGHRHRACSKAATDHPAAHARTRVKEKYGL